MTGLVSFCLVVGAAAAIAARAGVLAEQPRNAVVAGLVLRGGKVITVDQRGQIASAVAVVGNRIAAVGSDRGDRAAGRPAHPDRRTEGADAPARLHRLALARGRPRHVRTLPGADSGAAAQGRERNHRQAQGARSPGAAGDVDCRPGHVQPGDAHSRATRSGTAAASGGPPMERARPASEPHGQRDGRVGAWHARPEGHGADTSGPANGGTRDSARRGNRTAVAAADLRADARSGFR